MYKWSWLSDIISESATFSTPVLRYGNLPQVSHGILALKEYFIMVRTIFFFNLRSDVCRIFLLLLPYSFCQLCQFLLLLYSVQTTMSFDWTPIVIVFVCVNTFMICGRTCIVVSLAANWNLNGCFSWTVSRVNVRFSSRRFCTDSCRW